MVRNQILSLVIISSFLARKRSVPCWWLGCFEHHRFVRLERRLVGTQRTELWPRWTRKLEHGVWCVSIKLPTKKMHQGTDQYPMRTNSSRNLIMVNFSAYLNKFETFLPAARLVNMCCWSKRGGKSLAFCKPQFMCNLFETFEPQDFSKKSKIKKKNF